MFESPFAVGLSLYMYHNFKSQKAVSLMNMRVIFDNYNKPSSLKEGTRERRRGQSKVTQSLL
jgi:hypothetical protein